VIWSAIGWARDAERAERMSRAGEAAANAMEVSPPRPPDATPVMRTAVLLDYKRYC
jgi:hypothetical protein